MIAKNSTGLESRPCPAQPLLAVVCASSAVALGYLGLEGISPIGEWLFFETGFSEAATRTIEQAVAGALLVSVGVLFLPRSVAAALAVRVASLMIALSILGTVLARMGLGGFPFSDWALAAEATRFSAPIAVFLMASKRNCAAFWVLRLGAAATFTAHGFEALGHSPRFLDLVLISDSRVGGILDTSPLFDEASARVLLSGIGAIDLALALLCLALRSRVLWSYMAFWGLLTAASRLIAGGLEWWPATLERIPNVGVPLALVLMVKSFRTPK